MVAKANIPQGRFLQMPHKYRAYVAGYGAGKTWVGSMAIGIHTLKHPGVPLGYFAPTYGHIRDIFFPTIGEAVFDLGLSVDIKEGNKEVNFYTGRVYRGTLICRSMEKPHQIIGFKIGHALIDEIDVLAANKAEIAWRKILARMRVKGVGLKNGVDLATTPEGFKFTHKVFCKNLIETPELRKNYGIIQASTYDNEKNLPDDYIPSLVEAYPPELIDAYLNGQFVNLTSGTVYRSYDRKQHNSKETIQDKDPLYIGMDFNVQHMAATIYVQRGKEWHAVAELKDVFDTPEMIRIIQDKWQANGHSITIYPDASGKNRKSNNASESDILLLKQAKFKIKVRPSNPAVKDRVQATNRAFSDDVLFVNAKECPTVASCLEQQSYNSNGEPDKVSGFDHQNDATTYPISFEMPIKRPTVTTQSMRL